VSPLPPPAVYAPDASRDAATWPWVRPAAPAPLAAPVEAVATPARPGPPASPQTLAWVARYQGGDSVADIALAASTDPLWLAELAEAHGVTERTLRRDLAVVLRVVRATHQVEVRGRGVQLVARKAGR
jgi:hypothetical protein